MKPALTVLQEVRDEVQQRVPKSVNRVIQAKLTRIEGDLRMVESMLSAIKLLTQINSPIPGLDRARARELVAAGRRALAKEHHPDVGGSQTEMQHVNAVADALEHWLDAAKGGAR